MTDLTLTVERRIAAPPKAVFEAWLTPETLQKFMKPMPAVTVAAATCDPVPGGRFEILMVAGEDKMPHGGTYREITPYERLVFTWESHVSVENSEVTLSFVPDGVGTLVTLHQVRFADEQTRDNHIGGWTGILGALEAVV